MTNEVPLARWLQLSASATTRSTDGAARSPISRATSSDGRSISGAGSCSRPMKTSGRPLSSRRFPSSRTISVGGGRNSSTTRRAVDFWAIWLRLWNGPEAMTPPASQRIRIACAAPTSAPATRSRALRKPVPRALDAARPPIAPSASPSPMSPRSTLRTTTARRAGCSESRKGSAAGRIARPVSAAIAAPVRPSSCGSAPDRTPRIIASTIMPIAIASRRFTAGSCHTSRGAARRA